MGAFTDPDRELAPERVAELMREHADGWQVIDVREPYERDAGHVPASRHIELERLASQADTIDRDRPVIFYCRLGSRSAMATQAFAAAGYDAYNLSGGIAAWHAAGLAIEPRGGHVADH
jgi:rhodanese-related sulfurtransferase